LILEQIKRNGDNFSYVIADEGTGEAAIVDTSYNADEIIAFVKRRGLKARYVISTHCHSDHTAGNNKVKAALGSKIVAHRLSVIDKDIEVDDGDVLSIGSLNIRVMYTPGHTRDGICLVVGGAVITGDTLFIGECGRTDLPDGSPEEMFDSLFNKLMKLNDATLVYPGHDYGPKSHSTIGEERRTNYTLKERPLREFVKFMKEP
jgi:glyoxylase-like metal-dependent hydrolase (beta-lactamase superfamily II)